MTQNPANPNFYTFIDVLILGYTKLPVDCPYELAGQKIWLWFITSGIK
jgi:hypothetical protein